jgi:hypothetical protein
MSRPGSIPAGAPGMADGGLATLPIDSDMYNYAPGGIVAFADEDNEQLVPAADSEAVASGGAGSQSIGIDKLPVNLANEILMKRLRGDVGIPKIESPDEIRKRYIAENPDQAKLLNSLPGETLTKLAAALEKQNESQRTRFQEGEGRQGLAALSQALIAAGEATRGQRGFGGLGAAFGGFGKSYNASTEAAEQRASRQQALERAQTIETMKLQSDIENLQRAYAEGNVAKIAAFTKAVNDRQAKIEDIKGSTAKETLDQADKKAQRDAQAARYAAQEAHEQRMYEQAKKTANKPSRFEEELALLRKDPDLFKQMQGQAKSGTLTFEDAMRILIKDNPGVDMEELAQAAQKMVNASKIVQSGKSIPEPVKIPEDTRSFLDKISGKPAPGNFPALPPGFQTVN